MYQNVVEEDPADVMSYLRYSDGSDMSYKDKGLIIDSKMKKYFYNLRQDKINKDKGIEATGLSVSTKTKNRRRTRKHHVNTLYFYIGY